MTEALQSLHKVLALERSRKFADTAVIGGLDAYLQHFLSEQLIPPDHRFQRVLRSLPPDGYRALHPVQRRRVVEELELALKAPLPAASARPAETRNSETVPDRRPPRGSRESVRPRSAVVGTMDSSVEVLKGVSRGYAGKLKKLGVEKVGDLLWLFPFRYSDFSQVRPIAKLIVGEEQTVLGDVWSSGAGMVGRRRASEVVIGDETGTLRIVWWGQTHVARQLKEGMKIALSGKVTAFRGQLQMENPEWEPIEGESLHTRRLVPVYPGTEGLPQRLVRRLAREAVDAFADELPETLPEDVRGRLKVLPVRQAMRQMHIPESSQQAAEARRRFALEELLHIELGVVRRRLSWQAAGAAPKLALPQPVRDGFVRSLPFALTAAQRRAVDEVLSDIGESVPMSRLLEGDVGSGKTVVAVVALLAAVASGYQGAIMAPTEVLAEQHYRTFCSLFSGGDEEGLWRDVFSPEYLKKPLRITLLRGSLKASEKAAAQDSIARGETDIAIGTQALAQSEVSFQRLGFVVVDEQHRFGVEQRAALRQKGVCPHTLVMTATPIPRTLALTVYGDLDITVLDEMPPGRPPVKTYRLRPDQRRQAYDFLRKQIGAGRQAYVICPLVEESEAVAARAAVQEYERLCSDVFPDLRLGLLHGRMTPGEKDAVMREFRDGGLHMLVSTAVVEVGIDVRNATVMLVEGADRFGLAQLHQFRGRVRRSSEQAYCLLLSENPSEEAQERLRIMETTHDGFKLAEEDLRIRGPGEYFGTRQSGLPDLKVARLTDVVFIEQARAEAIRLLEADPELEQPQNRALAARMEELWGRITAEVS
ncbi:MAG: ATP-dependent DNA helicase RecG [Chloroflexi bacterium]|nr:ATP-dependent DNA helicase RecG [Chloroflexota bacterium]